MRIGADYYPEHWDKERWKIDAQMMVKANIKVIRIGEFAWSLYEPEEDRYDFSWMDEALDYFNQYGIKVVLCTPSATPPKWMTDRYPDIFQDDIHGNAKIFGTRKHYCFNSDTYRKKTSILVDKIAERYAGHPAVEAWQIDNELGWSNTTRCYCDKCKKKFQGWLKNKYKTIENLNKKYGTVFWSQIYNSFEEVIIPRAGACYDTCHDTQGQNPGLLLDYDRFSSDSVISFMNESVDRIKKYSNKPITTNMLDAAVNSGTGIDYFKCAEKLDFVSWDNYIEFQWGIAQAATVSRDHALLRSYKKRPFWVMEQQSGACGWSKMGPTPTPGKLRLWTYQAVANGADTVVYFRWRACPFGTEEYWHGILNHDGKPNRRYKEISQIGFEMEKLSQKFGALQPKAKVAIIKSFDSEWSHSIHKHVEGFQYDELLLSYYRPFYDMGIAVDFVSPEDTLEGYSLVLAPAFLIVPEDSRNNLENYVKNGGTLLISFRSGIKDESNNMFQETVPGCLRELAGVEINDYDPLLEKHIKVSGIFGKGQADLWCDIIEPTSAKTLGYYVEDFYAGKSCMTVNKVGKGNVYYLGCDLDDDAMRQLMEYLSEKADIAMEFMNIEGVEISNTTDGNQNAVFVMNHNAYPIVIDMNHSYTELITDVKIEDTLTLEPYGVAILQ
ncbi:MAG: beta-galactosidase [Lachnospiraceae bacterium]|nr:beta-galactosidase [Lachnospiraceae bacterium]